MWHCFPSENWNPEAVDHLHLYKHTQSLWYYYLLIFIATLAYIIHIGIRFKNVLVPCRRFCNSRNVHKCVMFDPHVFCFFCLVSVWQGHRWLWRSCPNRQPSWRDFCVSTVSRSAYPATHALWVCLESPSSLMNTMDSLRSWWSDATCLLSSNHGSVMSSWPIN